MKGQTGKMKHVALGDHCWEAGQVAESPNQHSLLRLVLGHHRRAARSSLLLRTHQSTDIGDPIANTPQAE